MKRITILLTFLMVLSMLLSACGGGTEAPAAEEPVEEAVVEEEAPAEEAAEEVSLPVMKPCTSMDSNGVQLSAGILIPITTTMR